MRADHITETHDQLRLKPKHGSESYRNRINFLRRSLLEEVHRLDKHLRHPETEVMSAERRRAATRKEIAECEERVSYLTVQDPGTFYETDGKLLV
jgi:hypothetical protein